MTSKRIDRDEPKSQHTPHTKFKPADMEGCSDALTPLTRGYGVGLLGELTRYLTDYVVMPGVTPIIVSIWIMAAWLTKCWDYFPILAVTSPEMRCGKTTLLGLIARVTPKSSHVSNMSPSVLFRNLGNGSIETLLIDEAQSLTKKGTDSGDMMREILCASVRKDGKAQRSVRDKKGDYTPKDFKTYGPKVLACIGKLDPVVADRCLPVSMKRKGVSDSVKHYRERDVAPRARDLHAKLKVWASELEPYANVVYSNVNYLNLESDRLADGLLPLQTVLMVEEMEEDILVHYANEIERANTKAQYATSHNKLLAAIRDLFEETGSTFIESAMLVSHLNSREDESWITWNNRTGIWPNNVAKLLAEYDIRPRRNTHGTKRGYARADMEDAFQRYLPPIPPVRDINPSA